MTRYEYHGQKFVTLPAADYYSLAADLARMTENDRLQMERAIRAEARLAEAEHKIDMARRIASAGYTAAPHQLHGRNLQGDFDSIIRALTTDSASVCLRCHGTGAIDTATSADDPSCPDCDGEGVKP